MIDLIFANNPFGLSYNASTQTWQIIFESNLNTTNSFSLAYQGDVTNKKQDSSWLLLFTTDNIVFTITSREQQYVFESYNQLQFYFDTNHKIYDIVSNNVVKDSINVLSINTAPDSVSPFTTDLKWDIISEYVGTDGYILSLKGTKKLVKVCEDFITLILTILMPLALKVWQTHTSGDQYCALI